MTTNLYNYDYDSFWKNEGKINICNSIQSNLIDGACGELNIYGKNHFCNILIANTCECYLKNGIMAKLVNIQHTDVMTISRYF